MKIPLLCGVAALFFLSACQRPAVPAAGGPPGGMPPTQVILAEARREAVTESLSLVGTLAANEMVELKSEIEGAVRELGYEEGRRVERGDLLVGLDDSKLLASEAEAEALFRLSEATHRRHAELMKDKLVSPQEFDRSAAEMEAHRATLELRRRLSKDARIVAPFAGVMAARPVSLGQVIGKNTVVGTLLDVGTVKVEMAVPERFLGQVRTGQVLELGVASEPGKKFRGEVYFVSPVLDAATRTALVKARIQNEEGRLRPGMFVNLDLALQVRDAAVVVPESAIMASGDRTMLYVVDGEGTAQIRPVKLGTRMVGRVEVVSGLQGGERVIAEGIQKVRPGGKVAEGKGAGEAGWESGKVR